MQIKNQEKWIAPLQDQGTASTHSLFSFSFFFGIIANMMAAFGFCKFFLAVKKTKTTKATKRAQHPKGQPTPSHFPDRPLRHGDGAKRRGGRFRLSPIGETTDRQKRGDREKGDAGTDMQKTDASSFRATAKIWPFFRSWNVVDGGFPLGATLQGVGGGPQR